MEESLDSLLTKKRLFTNFREHTIVVMRYFIRSVKYLLFICILYILLVWIIALTSYTEVVDGWMLLEAQLRSEQGVWLVAAFILLAIFYPRFGFMRGVAQRGSVAGDRVRIDNAMRLYGFEYVGAEGDTLIYRAKGVLKRATFLFEDRLKVRNVEDGIEIVGIRRAVARVVYQLQAYIDNSRYEEK